MLLSFVLDVPQPGRFLLASQPSLISSQNRFVHALTELRESVCKQMTLSPAFATLTKTRPNCTKIVQITPLESALTDAAPVTPLESALTEKGDGGVPGGGNPPSNGTRFALTPSATPRGGPIVSLSVHEWESP